METLELIPLDKENAGPFASYLLPQVRYDLAQGADIPVLGAVCDGHAAGALAVEVDGDVLQLTSLYVAPAVRRQGIGTVLVTHALRTAKDWQPPLRQVRCAYMVDEEDGAVIAAFLQSLDFDPPQTTERLFSVDTAKLHHLPVLGAAFSGRFEEDPHVRPFSAITAAQLEDIETDETVADYLKPSAMERGILRQGSTIWVENERVLAWVLAYQSFDGEIVMSIACKRKGAPKGSFRKLLQAAANRCYLMLGRDFTAYIATVNEHSGSLVERLAGGAQREYQSCVALRGSLDI